MALDFLYSEGERRKSHDAAADQLHRRRTGDSLPVTRMSAFHSISAELTMRPATSDYSVGSFELLALSVQKALIDGGLELHGSGGGGGGVWQLLTKVNPLC